MHKGRPHAGEGPASVAHIRMLNNNNIAVIVLI